MKKNNDTLTNKQINIKLAWLNSHLTAVALSKYDSSKHHLTVKDLPTDLEVFSISGMARHLYSGGPEMISLCTQKSKMLFAQPALVYCDGRALTTYYYPGAENVTAYNLFDASDNFDDIKKEIKKYVENFTIKNMSLKDCKEMIEMLNKLLT